MIIIPDIHGRKFWKDAISLREDNEKVIFLGDYVDPYKWEDISSEQVINNLKEIIEFKKSNMDSVILLIGNHDYSYINRLAAECRFDYKNADEIQSLFMYNKDLFQFGYYEVIEGVMHTFTHSHILTNWVNYYNDVFEDYNKVTVIDKVNQLWKDCDYKTLGRILNCISFERGGNKQFGSMIWADVCEFDPYAYQSVDYSIFGHSQQDKDPIITNNFACLDNRMAYRLNSSGKISILDKTKKDQKTLTEMYNEWVNSSKIHLSDFY